MFVVVTNDSDGIVFFAMPSQRRRVVSCLSFNQDGSRLAVGFGTSSREDEAGFAVFSMEPLRIESVSVSSTSTSTSSPTPPPRALALLFRTRVSALVQASQPNVVSLLDDACNGGIGGNSSNISPSSSLLGELSFPTSTMVLAVRLRRDAVAVALSDGRAAAYSLEDSLRLLRSVKTGPNDSGLLALAFGGARTIFACPFVGGGMEEEGEEEKTKEKEGQHVGGLAGLVARGLRIAKGKVPSSRLRHPGTEGEEEGGGGGIVRVEFVDAGRSLFIRAARHGIAAIALSQSGELLATASERGTLVRVFSLGDGSSSSIGGSASCSSSETAAAASAALLTPCLRELRRGGDPARMLSLAFSPSVVAGSSSSPQWLAAASDSGTVHVWRLLPSRPTSSSSSSSSVDPSRRSRLLIPALPSPQQLLEAAAAAAPSLPLPSAASLAAERSSFHFKLNTSSSSGDEELLLSAALSFSPGGKSVFAASVTGKKGEEAANRCGLVAVALPEEGGRKEEEGEEDKAGDDDVKEKREELAAPSAAAELFCVPDLMAMLPTTSV